MGLNNFNGQAIWGQESNLFERANCVHGGTGKSGCLVLGSQDLREPIDYAYEFRRAWWLFLNASTTRPRSQLFALFSSTDECQYK